MNKLALIWRLEDDTDNKVVRYCHNCGRKVEFVDSMKRRRNGNGKTIYEYAIYKCDREHTWNKPLRSYSAHTDISIFLEEESCEISVFEMPEEIFIPQAVADGITEIEILIDSVNIKWRTDKLLAKQIKDISRTQIKKWIEQGRILIDRQKIKPDTVVKSNNIITILL